MFPDRLSRLAVAGILVFSIIASVHTRYIGVPGNDWRSAINNDGKGYYEYLRMFLFRNGSHPGKGPLHPAIELKAINYFAGTAVLMSPFVLAAHCYTLFNAGAPEDGYSLHYQMAVGIAALFYLALGLHCSRRLLLEIGLSDGTVALALLLLALGTGLVVHAVVHPAMSHTYGFATVAMLLLAVRRLAQNPTPWRLLCCVLLIALACLIRPVNVLVVLALPVAVLNLNWDRHALKALLLSRWMVLAVLVGLVIVGLQPLLWFLQCGEFLVRPYPGEGFHWDRPEVLKSLFSPRNGLFFYWPVLLLVIPGAIRLARSSWLAGMAFMVFTCVFVYVTASWWNWAYGDCFGQRTYLDQLAVFAVPFALAIPQTMRYRRMVMVPAFALCALSLFQGWQYANYIMITGQMDLQKYRYLALRTDPQRALSIGGHDDMLPYAPHGMASFASGHDTSTVVVQPKSTSGAFVELLLLSLQGAPRAGTLHLNISLERQELIAGGSAGARFGIRLKGHNVERAIHDFLLNEVPDAPPAWHRWSYAFNLRGYAQGDTLLLGVDRATGPFKVRSVRVEASYPR